MENLKSNAVFGGEIVEIAPYTEYYKCYFVGKCEFVGRGPVCFEKCRFLLDRPLNLNTPALCDADFVDSQFSKRCA